MLSVAVHKNIDEYQPKIIGKLTTRTLLSIIGAVGMSVLAGLYLYFVLGLNPGDNMIVIYAVSLPFWCCGFFRPYGMPFEKFAPLWIKAKFTHDRIFYTPSTQLTDPVKTQTSNDGQKGKIYDKTYRNNRLYETALVGICPRP